METLIFFALLRHSVFNIKNFQITWLMCRALNFPPLDFAALVSWIKQPGQPVTTTAAPVLSMFLSFFPSILAEIAG